MGISRTVSEIGGDSSQKSQNFPTHRNLRPRSRGSYLNLVPALEIKKN